MRKFRINVEDASAESNKDKLWYVQLEEDRYGDGMFWCETTRCVCNAVEMGEAVNKLQNMAFELNGEMVEA